MSLLPAPSAPLPSAQRLQGQEVCARGSRGWPGGWGKELASILELSCLSLQGLWAIASPWWAQLPPLGQKTLEPFKDLMPRLK